MARIRNGEKEAEIYTQAMHVFREKGYHGTSMQDIARAVGLRKASLYHYIRSKEELLFQIFESGTGALNEQLGAIMAEDLPASTKLERAIRAHLTLLCDQLDWFTIFLREQQFFSGRQMAPVRAEAARHLTTIEQILEQGIDSGEFRRVDVKMTALAIIGMTNWSYQWYSPTGRLGPDQIAATFSDLVLTGLRADGHAASHGSHRMQNKNR